MELLRSEGSGPGRPGPAHSPAILLQSKAERLRAWIRTRLPICCLERDSWSAYIFPPQSRSAPRPLLLMGNSPVTPSQGC